ncbi:hypothetical protein VTK56DRAFT_9833 [Thermocarpiscus australiensis]
MVNESRVSCSQCRRGDRGQATSIRRVPSAVLCLLKTGRRRPGSHMAILNPLLWPIETDALSKKEEKGLRTPCRLRTTITLPPEGALFGNPTEDIWTDLLTKGTVPRGPTGVMLKHLRFARARRSPSSSPY